MLFWIQWVKQSMISELVPAAFPSWFFTWQPENVTLHTPLT